MIEQASFDFTARPAIPAGEVERLLNHLSAHPGFHTARELSESLNLSDRQLRNLAEQSDGLVISGPGSPGYCHLHHCDPETIGHIADALRSQARRMLSKSIRMRTRAHNLIR